MGRERVSHLWGASAGEWLHSPNEEIFTAGNPVTELLTGMFFLHFSVLLLLFTLLLTMFLKLLYSLDIKFIFLDNWFTEENSKKLKTWIIRYINITQKIRDFYIILIVIIIIIFSLINFYGYTYLFFNFEKIIEIYLKYK